jgi:hypothetical protein
VILSLFEDAVEIDVVEYLFGEQAVRHELLGLEPKPDLALSLARGIRAVDEIADGAVVYGRDAVGIDGEIAADGADIGGGRLGRKAYGSHPQHTPCYRRVT